MSAPSTISGRSGLLTASSLNANAGRRLANPPRAARIFSRPASGRLSGGRELNSLPPTAPSKHRIAGQSLIQRVGGQGSAVLHDGHAADAALGKGEFVPAQLGHVAQNRDRFVGDFGADAVAGDD